MLCLFPALLKNFQLTFQPLVGLVKLLQPLPLANWHLEAIFLKLSWVLNSALLEGASKLGDGGRVLFFSISFTIRISIPSKI